MDNVNGVICDWEGTRDVKRVGEKAAEIIVEVAEEWGLKGGKKRSWC